MPTTPMLVVAVQSALFSQKQVKGRQKRPDRKGSGGAPARMQDAVTTIDVAGAPERPAGAGGARWRVIARNAFPFLVVGAIWEIVAWAGVFPHQLFPTLEEVALSFVRLTVSGILPHHAIDTMIRLLSGFALASCARRQYRRTDGTLATGRRYLPAAGQHPERRYPASLIRRSSCSGSAPANSPPCCWSASSRCFRSSTTVGPA